MKRTGWLAMMECALLLGMWVCVSDPADAQWQVPDHAVPIGNGAGVTGFASAAPGTIGYPFVSNNATSDPSFQQLTGAGMVNNTVGNAQLRQGIARSVIGVAGNATANVADIQGTTDQILRVTGAGTGLGFGSIDLSKSAAVGTSILGLANGGLGGSQAAAGAGYLPVFAGSSGAAVPTKFAKNVMGPPYNAVCDGVTDDSAAFAAAMVAPVAGGSVYVPPGVNCYIGAGISVPSDVVLYSDGFVASPDTVSGTVLTCALSASPCVTVNSDDASRSASFYGFTVTRAAGVVPAASIGVQCYGQNCSPHHVYSKRHAIAYQWGDAVTSGISAHSHHLYSATISETHVKAVDWPELYITDSRFGTNGSSDVTCTNYMLLQGATDTVSVAQSQFNQGGGATCTNFVNFDGYTGTETRFANVHAEGLSGTSNAITSDATTTLLPSLQFVNSFVQATNFAALNVATQIQYLALDNFQCGCSGGLTLAPTAAINGLSIKNTVVNGPASITGAANSFANIQMVVGGNFTLAGGAWSSLVADIYATGSFTDTSTGTKWVKNNGTVTAGVWTGTKIGVAYGGTNADLSATSGIVQQASAGADFTVGSVALTSLATQATNTVVGNATSGSAAPTALAVGTCSTSSSALIWTTNTGFGCNTSINAATLGGATFAAPGAIGGGTPAAGTFTALTGTSGSITSLTGLAIRDTSAAFDVTIAATSSAALSAGRTLTLNMGNVAHILTLGTTASTGSGIIFPNTATDTVAMLGVGNTFTVNQLISASVAADLSHSITNANTANSASVLVAAGAASSGFFRAYGSTFAVTSLQNKTAFGPNLSSGVVIFSNASSASGGSGSVSLRGGGYDSAAEMILIDTNGVTMGLLATDATHTDRTVCQDTTSKTLFFGSGAVGICLGTSGAQFKTGFAPMSAGLAEIMKIPMLNYRYRDGYGDNGARVMYGPTAQDVEAVLPSLAGHSINGETINYDWGGLLFVGLHAIQQLKADNDNLRAEVKQIKRKVSR